jgi:hypothetical protein
MRELILFSRFIKQCPDAVDDDVPDLSPYQVCKLDLERINFELTEWLKNFKNEIPVDEFEFRKIELKLKSTPEEIRKSIEEMVIVNPHESFL